MVTRNPNGSYSTAHSTFRIPDSKDLRQFYEYWIERSKKALDLPFDTRKYRSLKFALTKEEFNQMNDALNDYALSLLAKFQSNSFNGRKLYMFESCLFPISKSMDDLVDAKDEFCETHMRYSQK